jgi:uncharacterized membrane protein YGL010W
MKTVQQWFAEYDESHQHETNKLFHWLGIPLIMFSLLGLLSDVPLPFVRWTPFVNLCTLFVTLALAFYGRLSVPLAAGMALVSGLMVAGHIVLRHLNWLSLWQVCLGLFVLGWIGQFAGHKIEGQKPSFFKDIQFLLIGPLWLLAAVYRRAGIQIQAVKPTPTHGGRINEQQ